MNSVSPKAYHLVKALSKPAFVLACLFSVGLSAAERPRLMVLTDIGGDPDDRQSMIRLMWRLQ